MYRYEDIKPRLFTDEGQRMFLRIRDNADTLFKKAGCARMDRLIAGNLGDVWEMMACVDRLVELEEIKELKYGECAGQYRIFYRPHAAVIGVILPN